MLWGEPVDHSVGGGPAKKPIHTKRASALPINNCEHGKLPTLCLEGYGGGTWCGMGYEFHLLEGLRWGLLVCAWDCDNPLLEGLRWELLLSAWAFENPLLAGLRWELDLSAWQAANCLQGGGLRWWRPL